MRSTVLAASQNYGLTVASATDLSYTDDDDDDDDDDDSDISGISSVVTGGDALPGFTTSLLRSRRSGFLSSFTIVQKLAIVIMFTRYFLYCRPINVKSMGTYIPILTEKPEQQRLTMQNCKVSY